jgi:hypothetical protein
MADHSFEQDVPAAGGTPAAGTPKVPVDDAIVEPAAPVPVAEPVGIAPVLSGTVRLSPTVSAVLSQLLLPGLIAPVPDHLPVAGTQAGNIFNDRYDANLRWYLPTFTLLAPDPAFSFAAAQTGVGPDGKPFNQAVLTLSLQAKDPDDVQQARAANPSLEFQQIPLGSLTATLQVPYKDSTGADATTTVAAQLTPQGSAQELAANGLLGPTVIQAYESLTTLGQATVELQLNYMVWQHVIRRPPVGWPVVVTAEPSPPVEILGPMRPPSPAEPSPPVEILGPMRPPSSAPPSATTAEGLGVQALPIRPNGPEGPPFWPPLQDFWYTSTATAVVTLPLGLTYAAAPYRTRYTITPAGGTTHPIVNANDLLAFNVQQSEYRELTTIGAVQQRYPSLNRLYYGQVSGTVIAIPARYGIICSSSGCGARLDAVVDPAAINGCRFHFTFSLAPVADPIDIARLARDLATTPEAQDQKLTLRFPDGLDFRAPGNLSGFAVASAAYANGPDAGTLLLAIDITDTDTTPAVVNVNLFLTQLTTPSPALFGQIGVRLDDLYTPVVQTTVILNLSTTSGTDDISVALAGNPLQVTATNRAPFDLRLSAFANITVAAITEIDINLTLPSTQSSPLPGGDLAASAVVVRRSIPVAEPFPKPELFRYLAVHTEDVQTIQHPLIVNATPVDFGSAQIAQVDIQFTLSDFPAIPVNSLTLTPQHRVDQVNVVIPVTVAVGGLNTTLTATVTGTDGSQRQVDFTNDFIANPIYVISAF